MRALHRAFSVLLVAAPAVGACSAFNPNVGPLQNDGSAVVANACALGSDGYGTSLGSPTGAVAAQDFCSADGGTLATACDTCEAASCCTQRVACYTDQACSCADTTVDACLNSSPTSDASSGASACWASFTATGTIAQARLQCLTKWCKGVCPLPS
jgi:hypothetical protein